MRSVTLSIVFVTVLVATAFAPSVQAAETRTVDGWIRIDPDETNMTVNFTWNSTDPLGPTYYNWNQTVEPFEANNSLNGSFTGSFLPPIAVEVTKFVNSLTLVSLVRFKSTWIMSGSTESWWRVPVDGPGWGDSANLTLWHIDSPATLNVSVLGTPNNISHPVKVFDQDFDFDATSLNSMVRYWNGTAWERGFNSTWVRVAAQVHTDEFYLVRWVIHNNGDPYWVRFSPTDQCEDRVFKTWVIHDNGTWEIYEADLDHSVLHVLGMGYGVWGHEIIVDGTEPKIEWNTQLDHEVQQGEYITVMVPFLDVVDNSTNVLVGFGTQNDSWSTAFWVAEDGPTDFGLKSVQWDVAWGATEFKVYVKIYNTTRSMWIMDGNPEFDPDWTWPYNRYTVDDHDWAPDDYYFGGVPYHSLQITNGSWENTHPTDLYYLNGRAVDPDQLMRERQDSPSWLVELWLEGYEGVARVTAAFSFALSGDFGRAWDVLDPSTPFPLDAPWYLGKFWLASLDFLSSLGRGIWAGLVWIYEVGQWIVENGPWILWAISVLALMIVTIPVWMRFFKVIWGLINFGWVLARDGVVAASDYADVFWANYWSTSYARRGVNLVKSKVSGGMGG